MKIGCKFIILIAFIALILPFSAGAVVFNPDGAVQNPVTGVYELPADLGACFDGTDTINASYANRPECLNVAPGAVLAAKTLRSVCQTPVQITSPAGYDLNSGTAGWNRCSIPNFSTNQTACEGAGGTWEAFTRCSKQVTNADCIALGGTAGGTSTTPTCTTTAWTADVCAAGGTAASGTPWVGSAAVSGATTTCTIYIGNDATACAAVGGGTISSTNTDETRGNCVNAWVFKQVAGTGATATSPGTGGSLTTVEARACLRCHNSVYQGVGSEFAEPENYIFASHKNASRKITPGANWAQINGVPEGFGVFSNYEGRLINWADGTIETAAGSGIYTDWYWYWGYYFEDPSNGSDIAENSVNATTGMPTTNFRACAYCHATGFSAENTLVTTKEPVKSFTSSIAWDGTTTYAPGSTPGVVNLRTSFNNRSNVDDSVFVPSTKDCTALGGTIAGSGATKFCRIAPANITQNNCVKGGTSIPGTPPDWAGAWIGSWNATTGCTITVGYQYNSWDAFGVLCSNCHNSVDGGHNNSATGTRKNVPRPTVAQPARGAQVNAVCLQCHAKASSGNAQNTAMDSQPLANSADISGGHPNYHGSEFMNSPHARFSGTYVQVTDTTKYSSYFAGNLGGCEVCHNPHGSVRENLLDPALMGAAVAEEGLKATCASCHSSMSASINHPTGVNTPMGDVGAPTDGCVICHMPRGKHLFRIAADNVTPKADGTYLDAAWVPAGTATPSATTACQQCHMAGAAAETLPFTAAQAAAGAKGMHTAGDLSTNADCLTCHAAGNTVGAPAIIPGTNHHGVYSTCMQCHPNGHNSPLPSGNAFCITCHTNDGAHAVHHGTANVSAACDSCHTIPGVTVPASTDANCMACHNAPQTTTADVPVYAVVQAGANRNHHVGTCTNCHEEGPSNLAAGQLAINAWDTAPNINAKTATLNTRETPNFWYWAINTSLRTACLSCHSTTQPKSGGGTTGAIVPSGAGDNHHNGHSSVPGLGYGGVAKIVPGSATEAGSRGDEDPGMNCLGCHGKATILSGSSSTGYVMTFAASGLSTSTVAAQNGRVDTKGLCLGCHEVVQSGPTQDHHAGECVSCHHTDGSYSGTYPAGVGTAPPGDPCLNCHATAQGASRAVNQGVDHHVGACTECHGELGGVSAWTEAGVAAPNIDAKTATLNTRETPNFWYWAINTSLRTACLGCHSTTQPKSGGGTVGAIIPSGTGDNHHSGHSSVPGTTFGGVDKIAPGSATNAGSRGDDDPGMNCLGCHGKATIVSGDSTIGYMMDIAGSGLSTTTVAQQNGRTDTSGLCLGCHEVIQSGADKDHHVGVCTSCHHTDGSFSGTYGAGVTSGQDAELNSSCLMCHSTAQGSFGAINLATLNHLPGTGTPVSFSEACVKCHKATNPPDASYPGVAPNVAATCGQCHDAAHYVAAGAPPYSTADLALVADGMHDSAGVTYPVTFTASSSMLTVSVAATVNCGGTCPSLTYDWDWGDGSVTLGGTASTSHLYAAGGSKTIKVTVKLGGKTAGTYTRSILLANPDGVPVASGTDTWDANTWTMSIVDTSTDDGPDADAANDTPPTLQIVISWGDGTTKTIGAAGQTFTHVYARPGTFTVTLRATDAGLRTSTTTFTASPAYFTIAGVVQNASGSAGLAGATVKIMRGLTIVKTIITPAGGVFTSGAILKPDTYTLTVTKAGYTFAKPAATLMVGPSQAGVVIKATAPLALAPRRLRKRAR